MLAYYVSYVEWVEWGNSSKLERSRCPVIGNGKVVEWHGFPCEEAKSLCTFVPLYFGSQFMSHFPNYVITPLAKSRVWRVSRPASQSLFRACASAADITHRQPRHKIITINSYHRLKAIYQGSIY